MSDCKPFCQPLPLGAVSVSDPFWQPQMELVRTAVLPYQWEILNDRVPGAAPSFCMHNFRAAAKLNRRRQNGAWQPPRYTFRGFEALPDDPAHPDDDKFYGFVFQDSDFAKWIEAVGYSLANHPDPALERTADAAIAEVCAAQQEDGYLDTYYILNGLDRAFTNLRDHHELYCFGHLAEGAVAYWQATGKTALLKAVCRYADLLCRRFADGPDGCAGYPGHEIAEMALFRLYEATGTVRYRDLGQRFLDHRGRRPYYFDAEDAPRPAADPDGRRYRYYQAHQPVREQREAVGHAVRAMYLYCGMADSARLTGDAAMTEACRALWRDVTARKMYVTGGVGSTAQGESFTFAYDLPNDTAYAETCAAIGLVFFARRMLALEPRAAYADVMERALYNGVLAGMSADGKRFFYVNPLEVLPAACAGDPRKEHVKAVRQRWFGCACCPPNLARLVGSVAQYAFAAAGETLYIHLHLGGTVRQPLPCGEAVWETESTLPWAGQFRLTARSLPAGQRLRAAVRIPGWCGGQYTLTGAGHLTRTMENGYLVLSGNWRPGDTVTFSFALHARLTRANPLVREDIGRVCVERGPLVYCLEQADNGANLHLCRIDPSAPLSAAPVTLLPGLTVPAVEARGFRTPAPAAEAPLYAAAAPVPEAEGVRLRFIPYYLWNNRGEGEMAVWVRAPEGPLGAD